MKRLEALLRKPFTALALSLAAGFAVGAAVLLAAGYNPAEAYAALLSGVFSKPRYLVQVLIKSTPIILTGLSVAFAFQTGLFNIGGEGQYLLGSMAAVLVGSKFSLPPVLHFLACVLAGMLAAALWGAVPGYLKAKYGIHEVITCIMLNWIALYLNNFLVSRPGMKKPGTEASYEISSNAWSMVLGRWKTSDAGMAWLTEHPQLRDVLVRTDLNYGFLVAVAVVLAVWFLLRRTAVGFELRAVGFNRDAAQLAGIDIKRRLVLSMAIAGALAGLAGVLQITGTGLHRLNILASHEGFGFDGISVALIASASPVGCILSGLLFGALKYGSASIQSVVRAPGEIIDIVIGTIVFCVAMATVFPMLADRLRRGMQRKGAAAQAAPFAPREGGNGA